MPLKCSRTVREHFQADGKGFYLCVGISAHSAAFPWHWDDPGPTGELCPAGGQVTQGRTPQTTAQPFKSSFSEATQRSALETENSSA